MIKSESTQIDLQREIGLIHNKFTNSIDKLHIPSVIKGDELTYVHEGGHIVAALAFNQEIYAYNISGKLKWLSTFASPKEKQRIINASLVHHEGVISHSKRNLTTEAERIFAAAGCAGELVYFNEIQSSVPEQEYDRKKGAFRNFYDIQTVAESLAVRFENGDLHNIFCFVMARLASGEGFDDVNMLIRSGSDIKTIFDF